MTLEHNANKPRLLLIDDSVSDRRLSELLLEDHFQIRLASGPKEAREILSEAGAPAPDLVLCDYRMPLEDGLQLHEALRQGQLGQAVPFIIMTAANSEAMQCQAEESKISAVLTKPIDPETAVPQMQRLMKLAQEQARQQIQIDRQNEIMLKIEQELARQAALLEAKNTEVRYELTGVERFQKILESRMQADTKLGWAVLWVDINRFRDVSTGYGHAAARSMLEQVGHRLRSGIREEDLMVRCEPDSFLLALPLNPQHSFSTAEDYLLRQAQRMLAMVAQPIVLEQENVELSACIGIAHASTCSTAQEFVDHSSQALTAAKALKDGSSIAVYRPEQLRKFREAMMLEWNLRKALRNDEICPYYQPQIDLRTGQISGAESLARWRLPDGSFVPPMHFIPIAESAKLIGSLGDLMLKQVAADLNSWRALLPQHFRVGINVSADQFARESLRGEMLNILDRYQIDPSLVELELTESILVEDTRGLAKRMCSLRDDGFSMAMDDFGTGYSSLSSIRDLPFDRIKIDRAFIRDLPTNPKSAALLSAIVTMGSSFGYHCVAEGIEDTAQQLRSSELGVAHGQGFLYGRAVSADEFRDQFLTTAAPADLAIAA